MLLCFRNSGRFSRCVAIASTGGAVSFTLALSLRALFDPLGQFLLPPRSVKDAGDLSQYCREYFREIL
jgi:hypothetical protein